MNVTYGYTAAGYTGRMPCTDIADSTVGIGRHLMMKSQEWIEERKEWRAKVIYGDTDSLFILMNGRSVEQAIQLGVEMCKMVTSRLPFPMELKFEKVIKPFIAFSKKRYVGYKYETATD